MNLRFIPLAILLLVSCSDESEQDYQNYLNSRPKAVTGEFLEDYTDKYLAEQVGRNVRLSHTLTPEKRSTVELLN